MPRSKGRTGRPWRKVAEATRQASDICVICGHSGARTVHHDPPLSELEAQGIDPRDPRFLHVAHGAPKNPCPTCRRNCNQLAGTKSGFVLPTTRPSRNW